MAERFNWLNAANVVLTTALAAHAAVSFVESKQVQNAWRAYNASTPECSEVNPDLNKYGAIVVFGADQNGNNPSSYKTDLYKGAADAYLKKYSDNIIIVADIPGYKQRQMFRQINGYIKAQSHGQENLSFNQVHFINHTYSYSENMKNLAEYMASTNITDTYALANWYDINMLRLLAQNLDVKITLSPAECYNPLFKPKFNQDTTDALLANNMLIGWSVIDPKLNVPAKFKSTIKKIKYSK